MPRSTINALHSDLSFAKVKFGARAAATWSRLKWQDPLRSARYRFSFKRFQIGAVRGRSIMLSLDSER